MLRLDLAENVVDRAFRGSSKSGILRQSLALTSGSCLVGESGVGAAGGIIQKNLQASCRSEGRNDSKPLQYDDVID